MNRQCMRCGRYTTLEARRMCHACYSDAVRNKEITTNDVLFMPGMLYIMRGERQNWCKAHYFESIKRPVYKIGVTSNVKRRLVELRMHNSFGKNIELVHSFPVDNMRVIEKMFHYRYADRCPIPDHEPEWFMIEDKLPGLLRCEEIVISESLRDISCAEDLYLWWRDLSVDKRKAIIPLLWKSPLLKMAIANASQP